MADLAPFFTTKEHGTGLGLAITREFTEAHGGSITVQHRDGPGATFVPRVPMDGPPDTGGAAPEKYGRAS